MSIVSMTSEVQRFNGLPPIGSQPAVSGTASRSSLPLTGSQSTGTASQSAISQGLPGKRKQPTVTGCQLKNFDEKWSAAAATKRFTFGQRAVGASRDTRQSVGRQSVYQGGREREPDNFMSIIDQLVESHDSEVEVLRNEVAVLKERLKKARQKSSGPRSRSVFAPPPASSFVPERQLSSLSTGQPDDNGDIESKAASIEPTLAASIEPTVVSVSPAKGSPSEAFMNVLPAQLDNNGQASTAALLPMQLDRGPVSMVHFDDVEDMEDIPIGEASKQSTASAGGGADEGDEFDEHILWLWTELVTNALERTDEMMSGLHPVWDQSNAFIRVQRWSHPGVDIWVEAKKMLTTRRLTANGEDFINTPNWRPRGMAARHRDIGDVLFKRALDPGIRAELSQSGSLNFGDATMSVDTARNRRTGVFGTIIIAHRSLYSKMKGLTYGDFVMRPTCRFKMAWTFCGIFLMLLDLVLLPMTSFDFDESAFTIFTAWFSQFFWTFDILFNFVTGIFRHGTYTTSFTAIASTYMKGWFVFDLLVVAPIWLVEIFSGGASEAGAFRYFRLLRFLRLVRLIKFDSMLQDALSSVNSPITMLLLGMAKLMLALVFASHLNACAWYAVGNVATGWVEQVQDSSKIYKYFVSMHWALTQFQGTSEITPGATLAERAYAVVIVLISLLGLSTFVSTLTNQIMDLQQLNEDSRMQTVVVRKFLQDHGISHGLAMRVRQYVQWKHKHQKPQLDSKLTSILSEELIMDLNSEVRGPLLANHPFLMAFTEFYPRLTRRMTHHALQVHSPAPGELIFATEEFATSMYFVKSGELLYTLASPGEVGMRRAMTGNVMATANTVSLPSETESDTNNIAEKIEDDDYHEHLGAGAYLSESALWISEWQHRGALQAPGFCFLMSLDSLFFGQMVQLHPPALCSCVLYARRFVESLDQLETDIIDPLLMIPEDRSMACFATLMGREVDDEGNELPEQPGALHDPSAHVNVVSLPTIQHPPGHCF